MKGGYSGLAFTSELIADYLPDCEIYVEPFAGMGRVGKFSNAEKKVFNDMSDYAVSKLKNIFPTSIITQEDFEDCIKKWDSKDTFFLMDPPWRKPIYDDCKAFIDRTPKDYYNKIFGMLPTLKGNWFVCSSLAERGLNRILSKSGHPILDLKFKRMICGKPATVKIASNKPFIKKQITLDRSCK